MQNPYQTLGVERNATADEIKRAYRKLASQHHPDKGGDKTKFQEIQSAYDTLSDPQKRAGYDSPQNPFSSANGQGFDFDSIFNVFGARFNQPRQHQRAMMTLWITLPDAARGGPKTISVGTHQGTMTVEIEIPPGIDDGASVQYPGIGPSGMDLVITFRIHPNPRWERQGPNLITDHPVDVWALITGTEITVQDILGTTLSLNVPARTQPGTTFRLRERGLAQRSGATGDLLVRVQARIPENIPQSIIDAINQSRNQ
jgi:DnaJ-class molecular chaperone